MNGTRIALDTCAIVKLLEKQYDLTPLGNNVITVIPLNEAIEQAAVELRRSTSLKLPDSIVAATSIVLDAFLLTDDRHLLGYLVSLDQDTKQKLCHNLKILI